MLQHRLQGRLPLRAPEALVETAALQLRILLLRLLDHSRQQIHVALRPHDAVAQHELLLVFHHAHRHSQLHRRPRLALRAPARERHEHRVDLLRRRNHFAPQDPPLHLIRQRPHQFDQLPCFLHAGLRHARSRQRRQRALRPLRQLPRELHIALHVPRVLLVLLRPPHPGKQPLPLLSQLAVLPPPGHSQRRMQRSHDPQQTPQAVPHQAHIRRVLNIRLHHERIAACLQRLLRFPPQQTVTGPHHHLIDLLQQWRCQQRHIAHHRPIRKLRRREDIAQTQHASHIEMLAGQLVQPVVIAVQRLLQNRQHQNAPKTHARAPHIGIDLLAVPLGPVATPVRFAALEQVTAEQIEDLLQQVGIAMNGLDP